MLILTRKLGEVICIGKDTRVKILAIKGYQVRIGIEAPLQIEVHREEVYNRIKLERDYTPQEKQGGKRSNKG